MVIAGQGFDPAAVASLASRRTYPLRSAFRPTANMAVNLLERFDLTRARETLETSFAQFQADRSVVGLARRARELEDTAADYASALECDRGDLLAYADLQERIATREKELSRDRASADRDRARATLRSLHRGDVLALPGGSAAATPWCWTWTARCSAGPSSRCWTPRAAAAPCAPWTRPPPPP